MPRRSPGLTAQKVARAKPGRYSDGSGLYLLVRGPEARFWVFRYVRGGRMREAGLGPAAGRAAISLAEARRRARDLWDVHQAGGDPLAERAAKRSTAIAEASKGVTFRQAAIDFIEAHRHGWRNPVHIAQWQSTLSTYAFPLIGDLLVGDITTSHVVDVLKPIWGTKPETASRLRGRIESVLGREKALGHRDGENPARWRENIDAILPKRSKVQRVQHHPAMPYRQLGAFMEKLRADGGTVARALEFTILTAARTGETVGARWNEIDLDAKLWVVPGERMKASREHRVALSARAVDILKAMQNHKTGDEGFVFPGASAGRPMSNMAMLMLLRRMGHGDKTVHGFRSCFRDWVGEATAFPGEVAELALAHSVADKVEGAYRRGDQLAKRFELSEAWSRFCAHPPLKDGGDTVVSIKARKTAKRGAQ